MADKTTYLVIFLMIMVGVLAFLNGNYINNTQNTYFQVSNYSALAAGEYLGNVTVDELKNHSNTAIGTVNYLDGEMVEKNGTVYQITSDGKVHLVNNSQKIPFAMSTEFQPENSLLIKKLDYQELKVQLNRSLSYKKTFYAIVISGNFSYIKLRSVPAQKEPFVPLSVALENQSVFNHQNISGTLIGFWCPEEYSSINLPGCHFHFISDDGKIGGHVLDFDLDNGLMQLDKMEVIQVVPG